MLLRSRFVLILLEICTLIDKFLKQLSAWAEEQSLCHFVFV